MLKKIKMLVGATSSSAILLASNKVMAATIPSGANDYYKGNLGTFIGTALNVVLGAAGFVAIIYVIIGGFNYVTSAGNAEKVATANKTIAYAIIGIVIVALAFAMKSFVLSKLGLESVDNNFLNQ